MNTDSELSNDRPVEPVPPPIPPLRVASEEQPSKAVPLKMPAPAETAARDIARIGVEGRPADATAGPGTLIWQLTVPILIVLAMSIGLAVFVNWAVGIVAFGIGLLGILMNPVVGATVLRVKDRAIAARMERMRRRSS